MELRPWAPQRELEDDQLNELRILRFSSSPSALSPVPLALARINVEQSRLQYRGYT